MEDNKLISEISNGVTIIGNSIFKGFIASFGKNEADYGEAAKLEAEIASFFSFDYWILSKQKEPAFRQSFYKTCTANMLSRYSDLENENLQDLIDKRYDEYGSYPGQFGEGWRREFQGQLETILKGSRGKNRMIMHHLPTIEDFESNLPLTMRFMEMETNNFYRIAKIVEEIFNNKSISEAIEIVRQIESKGGSVNKKKNNKDGGCYIATMVYGGYYTNEVLLLREYRDEVLSNSLLGRLFIKIYYKTSPIFVKYFKNNATITSLIKVRLDRFVSKLKQEK